MSIGREYYDKDGNYWQIETPRYIPPEEAIKNPSYVRGFISAEELAEDRKFAEKQQRDSKYTDIGLIVSGLLLIGVIVVSRWC